MIRVLLAAFLCALSAHAADRTLLVTDPAGRPIPRAEVVLIAPDGRTSTATTGADGTLVLDFVEGAVVTASKEGFATPDPVMPSPGGEVRIELIPEAYAEEIVVSAAQSRVPLAELSSSVSVLGRERVSQDLHTSRNLADVLGKNVPGLAPGSGSASLYGQTIRGRGIQILVDGVPLTTLRNVTRDLVSIDPSIVERVEVLRGTTALYGDGATGGLINIVTRRPQSGDLRLETNLTGRASLSHPDESLGGRISQSLTGGSGALDYRLDFAADRTAAFFDPEGDRIAPDPYGQGGMADTDGLSLAGKLGWTFSRDARLQIALNAFESEQDTEWSSDPSVNGLPPLSTKSRAIRGVDFDHPQGSTNRLFQATFEDANLLGSKFAVQAFARDYQTVFTPFDGRGIPIYGHQIFQSRLESESLGLRADFETPLPWQGMTLFWGTDAGSEETAQPVWILDPQAYSASGGRVFRTIDDRPWVPLIDKHNAAAFAQLEWMLGERWLVRGGMRYESVTADIPSFETLAGTPIDGGARDWSDTLFNVGLVHYLDPKTRVWTTFSQGFSLPDIGLVLRSAPAGASLDTLPFAPQTVDAWEIGSGTDRGRWSGSVAAFYNTSELGTSTAGFNQPVVRAPERVYGAEISGELRASDRLALGGSFAWNEGKTDPNRDGIFTYLNHYRIAAPNANAWVQHETTPRWTNRVSVLWSGDRDRFPGSTAFGERPIESYAVVDWLASFDLARGRLDVGIENLLNEEYYVRDAQLLRSGRNDSHTLSPGATLSLGWTLRY